MCGESYGAPVAHSHRRLHQHNDSRGTATARGRETPESSSLRWQAESCVFGCVRCCLPILPTNEEKTFSLVVEMGKNAVEFFVYLDNRLIAQMCRKTKITHRWCL